MFAPSDRLAKALQTIYILLKQDNTEVGSENWAVLKIKNVGMVKHIEKAYSDLLCEFAVN